MTSGWRVCKAICWRVHMENMVANGWRVYMPHGWMVYQAIRWMGCMHAERSALLMVGGFI
jgi:hypothetical protein